jgi:hypothetical protein
MIPTKDPAFLFDPLNVETRRHHRRRVDPVPDAQAVSGASDSDEGGSMVAEVSSSGSVPAADPKLLRYYSLDSPLQWNVFVRLRKSWGDLNLTEVQQSNVMKAIEKVRAGSGNINDSHPFVSAIVDRHCPELKPTGKQGPREGCTFLLLAVITGDIELLKTCLELGANPNDVRFLTEPNALMSYVRHGYTPFFMACVCERIDCMQMLHDKGGSLHVADRWGRTPLHAAAALGNKEVIDWLLRHGAPRLVTDRDSLRPGELSVGKVLLPGDQQHVLLRTPSSSGEPPACPCGSSRRPGSCGCFDDMHERWFFDRVGAQWIPMEFIDAISNAATTAIERYQTTTTQPGGNGEGGAAVNT